MLRHLQAALLLLQSIAMPLALLHVTANAVAAQEALEVTEHCWVQPGAVNGVVVRKNDKQLAVYGWDEGAVDQLLLTHGRRDVLWRADAARKSAEVIAPLREKYSLESGPEFWSSFAETRYHDYAQQSTKLPNYHVKVARWVAEGEVFRWQGLEFQVLETPGFTRGGCSYVVTLDGKRIGFTGDLIYGNGQTIDLYSFQDAIPEAQIRGYHGYGARLASLVASLDKIVAARLDVIVPARGPVIHSPTEAAKTLKSRVQAIYHNYLSTNALHWYFKEDRMRKCGELVLGSGDDVELMPYCHHEKTPSWIYENGTSRLLISKKGAGFLLDCGNPRVIEGVQTLIEQGVIDKVDGIFVTHYHDDHTDSVQAAAEKFQCPVYATPEYADVLERPIAYHLPAMTANPIRNVKRMKSGEKMKWNEFQLTFHFFPGQTYYHGALYVERPDSRPVQRASQEAPALEARPVFFIGDAFAPSGIDDYCVLNRNLLHDDQGFLDCLAKVQSKDCWLINEHIPYVFAYNDKEAKYLRERYLARREMLKELFPWDDPNYGVDEQWAVFYPRGAEVKGDSTAELAVRLTNHSPKPRTFTVTPQVPEGVTLTGKPAQSITLAPNAQGAVKFSFRVAASGGATRVITADIDSDAMSFRRWADAILTVK